MQDSPREVSVPRSPARWWLKLPRRLPWLLAATAALVLAAWLADRPRPPARRASALGTLGTEPGSPWAEPDSLWALPESPWARPGPATGAAAQALPVIAKEVRTSFLDYATPAIDPRWLHRDLRVLLQWHQVAPGLEGLERNVMYAQYEVDGGRVSVLARFTSVALIVDLPTVPQALRAFADKPPEPGPAEPRPWADAPPEVVAAMRELWGQFIIARSEAEPAMCRYAGQPALTARLPDLAGTTWWADCLLVCDGRSVGILLTKSPGIWNISSAIRDAEPLPREPAIAPLNPKWIILQETGFYRGAMGHFVSQPKAAKRGLIRVLSVGSPMLPAGATRLYSVPISGGQWSGSVWRALEFHALASGAVENAHSAASSCGRTEGDNGPAGPVYLAEASDRLAPVVDAWQAAASPPELRAERDAVTAALTAAQQAARAALGGAANTTEPIRRASKLTRAASDSLEALLARLDAKCTQYEQNLYHAL